LKQVYQRNKETGRDLSELSKLVVRGDEQDGLGDVGNYGEVAETSGASVGN
jgi:hypothetical protein